VARKPSAAALPSPFVIISSRVTSQLLTIVATFLPLKAVIIAADQRVPRFVPEALAVLEPVPLALLFACVAAVSAALSGIVGRFANQSPTASRDSGPHAVSGFLLGAQVKEEALRKSDVVLVVLFLTIATIASVWFIAILALLVLGTLSWFRIAGKDDQDQPLDNTEALEVSSDFLNENAVWVAVVAALGSVWFAGSQLGVTAVLIGVIVSRQALVLGSNLVKTRDFSSEATGSSKKQELARSHQRKRLEKFETAVLQALSDNVFLERMTGEGKSPELQFLDSSQSRGMSAVVLASRDEGQVLVRFLDHDDSEGLDRELSLLSALGAKGVTIFQKGSPTKRLGVTSYSRVINTATKLENDRQGRERAWGLQIKLEYASISGELVPPSVSRPESTRRLDSLFRGLERVMSIPGNHQEPVELLLSLKTDATLAWNLSPKILGFPGGIQPSRALGTDDGGVELLDPSGWRLAPLGVDWPTSRFFDAMVRASFSKSPHHVQQIPLGYFCREITQLESATHKRVFSTLGAHAKKALSELQKVIPELPRT
jgi:hypothetical protein